ncbi:hypothetical protein RJ640_024317 [Escallonia rubra]|uniref:Late embryogenesis abundant protein LEA-2 subgroup domain-containing protein n=1 Tax=Escallonia rubra TaxID=112253 RepID=A0AA88UKD0_9ASTE|nr:hypothetical protein RJ640_024317 [Escallonia rubra]
MIHAKSESDVTSLAPSSPTSPKRHQPPAYYVESASRDSHDDGDKSSTMHPTPTNYNSSSSPMDSPSHPSTFFGRHSQASSASRVSGAFRKRSEWRHCNVIDEEGDCDDFGDQGYMRRCQFWMAVLGFGVVFGLFCLVIWGASRPFKAQVSVKSLTVNNFYSGEGSDFSGVPTKLLTVNCSVKMVIHNPATFFGIHVSSSSVDLMYTQLKVASGQIALAIWIAGCIVESSGLRFTRIATLDVLLKRYYQRRKSHRTVSVNLEGNKVPLYGAGASFGASDNGGGVPLKLVFEIRSRGNVVGKLVKSKHRRHVACYLVIVSRGTKTINFKENSCTYD